MTAQEAYDTYQIMPTLQLHQLRVAAVSQLLCNAIPNFENTKEVVTTCLLHDMGNIIKFDLNYFPEFLKPEGLEYWQKVKDEYIKTYGESEHYATQSIIAELVDSERIKEYANQVGFSKLQETENDTSLAKKICAYSDMRVGPHGVISINERVADGRKRYEGRIDKAIGSDRYEVLANALKEVEKQIFEIATIKPDDITDELITKKITELRGFVI
jgi:hypothetical protein